MVAAGLCALVSLAEYREPRQRVFPSENSLQWFLRSHRPALVEAGALLKIAGRWHIEPAKFDQLVLEAGANEARRTVDMAI